MEKSTYVKLLIDESLELNKKQQKDIISFLFDVFVQCQNDTLLIHNGIIKKVKSKQAFATMAKMIILIEFNIDISYYDKKTKKQKTLIRINEIYDTITTVNSYDLLSYESNLFDKEQTIIKDDLTSTIKVITNKIHVKEIDSIKMSEDDYSRIIDDYKQHFKYFDELLDLIVDMRFAKDRKASFVHLRVKSDWGKSFLSGLLKNIEIGFEVDYHNLMNKGANDIAPVQVRNSFVLLLDEFNNFSQEMKKLSHNFIFAPKFGMSEQVELYLKILLSAEKSPSFTGGVDNQIVNRVMVFDMPDHECVTLVEREEYIYHGNAKYMEALKFYASRRILDRIKEYLSLPEFEAHKKADDRVRNTYDKYKMDAESLIGNVSNVINDTIHDIVNGEEENQIINNLRSDITIIQEGKYTGKYFIGNVSRVFETILKHKTSESEYKKMRYKLNNLEEVVKIIEDRRQNRIRINGKQRRGLVIDIADLKEEVEYHYESIAKEAEGVF